MALSPDDKAIVEATYARTKSQAQGAITGIFMGAFIGLSQIAWKDLRDPHASHQHLILLSNLLGLLFAGCVVASFFFSRQRKRDLELVRFFEKHFPEDCSWKQEEKVLAEAEDLRLKAKVYGLIHQ
jgi:hypothetical protein